MMAFYPISSNKYMTAAEQLNVWLMKQLRDPLYAVNCDTRLNTYDVHIAGVFNLKNLNYTI